MTNKKLELSPSEVPEFGIKIFWIDKKRGREKHSLAVGSDNIKKLTAIKELQPFFQAFRDQVNALYKEESKPIRTSFDDPNDQAIAVTRRKELKELKDKHARGEQ